MSLFSAEPRIFFNFYLLRHHFKLFLDGAEDFFLILPPEATFQSFSRRSRGNFFVFTYGSNISNFFSAEPRIFF
jgi:hypothetical protein